MAFPRYNFDNRFDEAVAEPAPESDPLDQPIHSERALRDAVTAGELRGFAAGAEQGRAEGMADALQGIEADTGKALAGIERRLDSLSGDLEAVRNRLETTGGLVVLTLVQRLAPRLLDLVAADDVVRLAAEVLRTAAKAPVLSICVNPDLVDPLRARLAGPAAGFAGRLEVTGDPALGLGAIVADWETGSLSYDPAVVESAVAAFVAEAVAALPVLSDSHS